MPVEPRTILHAFPQTAEAATANPHYAAVAAEAVVLKSLRRLAERTAIWRQPSQLRQDFELTFEGEVIGALRWKKNGGTTAVARSPDGAWSFKTVGYLNPRVTLRLPNSEYDFATFRPRSTGEGTLHALGDQRFEWRCTNSWHQVWGFFDSAGHRLVQITPEGVHPRVTARVEFDELAGQYSEIGYLPLLGWYLLVLMADDVAASHPEKL